MHDNKLAIFGLLNIHLNIVRLELRGLFQRLNRILNSIAIVNTSMGNSHWQGVKWVIKEQCPLDTKNKTRYQQNSQSKTMTETRATVYW